MQYMLSEQFDLYLRRMRGRQIERLRGVHLGPLFFSTNQKRFGERLGGVLAGFIYCFSNAINVMRKDRWGIQ